MVLILLSTHLIMAHSNNNVVFSKPESENIESLEKQLAYIYGVQEPEKIFTHYIRAIQYLDSNEYEALENSARDDHMLLHLRAAYEEVKQQSDLSFQTDKVAELELSLILAQAQRKSSETIQQIMIALYQTVFDSQSDTILKAAMLRTFLYQYKIALLNCHTQLTQEDQQFLLNISHESKRLLDSLLPQ